MIQARRLRNRFFEEGLFADPWDMLLDLFRRKLRSIVCLYHRCALPLEISPTTALRWINTMTDADLFRRRSDPTDARRVFVELSPIASHAMRRYFHEIGNLQSVLSDYPEGMEIGVIHSERRQL